VKEDRVQELVDAGKEGMVNEQRVQELMEAGKGETIIAAREGMVTVAESLKEDRVRELVDAGKEGFVNEQRVQELTTAVEKAATTEQLHKKLKAATDYTKLVVRPLIKKTEMGAMVATVDAKVRRLEVPVQAWQQNERLRRELNR
jgi:outer membrane murein-binding lipoprotein Lpp